MLLRASSIACATLLCWLAWSNGARAYGPSGQSDTESLARDAPVYVARQRGTHLLLELTGGATPGGDGGPAGAFGFGVGGRPRGSVLRVYGMAELSFAEANPRPALHALSVERDERAYVGLACGVRLYVPLVGPLRVFIDGLVGASYNHAALTTAVTLLEDGDWYVQGALAGGVQYRVLRAMSLGVRVKWLASRDPLWDLRRALGLSNALPFVLSAGLTWHF